MKKQSAWYQDKILIRLLAYLPKRFSEFIKYKSYVKSSYSERIKNLKNKYNGETCFIIGNGPSLNADDLEKIRGYYSFGVNKVYHIFNESEWRPDFYVCVDNRALEECYSKMHESKSICFFDYQITKYSGYHDMDNVYLIKNRQRFFINRFDSKRLPSFSKDISISVESGETVIYNAIQIAVYLGFRKIFLLGVDCNYSKVFTPNGKIKINSTGGSYFSESLDKNNDNVSNIIGQLNAFKSAKKFCDENNIEIYNATRGGKLETFDRVNITEFISL